jgi:hypothetical protein
VHDVGTPVTVGFHIKRFEQLAAEAAPDMKDKAPPNCAAMSLTADSSWREPPEPSNGRKLIKLY